MQLFLFLLKNTDTGNVIKMRNGFSYYLIKINYKHTRIQNKTLTEHKRILNAKVIAKVKYNKSFFYYCNCNL